MLKKSFTLLQRPKVLSILSILKRQCHYHSKTSSCKLNYPNNEYQNKLLQIEQNINTQTTIMECMFIINIITTPLIIYLIL